MITKAQGPDESLSLAEGGDPVLASYYRLMRLKRLYRQGWLKRGVPTAICESVAEHSFGTALLGLLLTAGPASQACPAGAAASPGAGDLAATPGHEGQRLDPVKVVLLALIHEMGESYAGDITPVDGVSKEEKRKLERAAIERSLDGLPDAAWFLAQWEDFEEGSSPEARFVRELDRLEMGLEAALYASEGYPGMGEFFESSRKVVRDNRLSSILEEAIAASDVERLR
jgi:putative hydrolase of HD superfamily